MICGGEKMSGKGKNVDPFICIYYIFFEEGVCRY